MNGTTFYNHNAEKQNSAEYILKILLALCNDS